MNEDRNTNLHSDPTTKPELRHSTMTPPPANRNFGVPLLIAAFILVAAVAGLVMATPKPVNDDSIMPMASTDTMTEPAIEPAAQGVTATDTATTTATATTGTATTEASPVTGTTTADTNAAVVTPGSSITPPAVYATQDACEDANNDATCFKQACDTISSVRCPEGATEGWSPSATFNNTDGAAMDNNTTNNTNANTNNAIPPAENPAAPRNDGTVNTPATGDTTGSTTTDETTTTPNSGTGTTGSMGNDSTGTTAPTTTP